MSVKEKEKKDWRLNESKSIFYCGKKESSINQTGKDAFHASRLNDQSFPLHAFLKLEEKR